MIQMFPRLSLTASLLFLILVANAAPAHSASNFCLSAATIPVPGRRFVDPDALLFNLSRGYSVDCQTLCCSTAGCVAFSLTNTANADKLFPCYLHQSPTLITQQSDNYTATVVNTDSDPRKQTVHTLTLSNVRLTDALILPNTVPWTASNCSAALPNVFPGTIAVEAVPTSTPGQHHCRYIGYFTSISADTTSNATATLLSHAVPQPTPLTYNYSHSSTASSIRGWNTYDSYGGVPPEDIVMANAESMATHMLAAGYRVVSLDYGWWFDMHGGVTLDELGRYQPAADRFPSSAGGKGLRPLADKLHSMGLLLGVYEDAGISIYYNNTGSHHVPVGQQCVWPGNSYFLDWSQPAAQEWLDGKVQQWADWDVDYVKIDCVGSIVGWQNVFQYSTAIARSSRPDMILSISPGYNGDTQSERIIAPYVNQYRIAVDQHDLWDEPNSIYPAIPQAVDYAIKLEGLYAGLPMVPNAANRSKEQQRLSYPDMDILPFGRIYSMPQGGNLTLSAFNHTQQQTAFAIWCFYRSPLLYGGRLTPGDLDLDSIAIVTNHHLLHIHQNAYRSSTTFVNHTWLTVRTGREELGEEYVLVANINSTALWEVEVDSSSGGECDWMEAWSGRMESGVKSVKVGLPYAHSAVWIIGNCTAPRTEQESVAAKIENESRVEKSRPATSVRNRVLQE